MSSIMPSTLLFMNTRKTSELRANAKPFTPSSNNSKSVIDISKPSIDILENYESDFIKHNEWLFYV